MFCDNESHVLPLQFGTTSCECILHDLQSGLHILRVVNGYPTLLLNTERLFIPGLRRFEIEGVLMQRRLRE